MKRAVEAKEKRRCGCSVTLAGVHKELYLFNLWGSRDTPPPHPTPPTSLHSTPWVGPPWVPIWSLGHCPAPLNATSPCPLPPSKQLASLGAFCLRLSAWVREHSLCHLGFLRLSKLFKRSYRSAFRCKEKTPFSSSPHKRADVLSHLILSKLFFLIISGNFNLSPFMLLNG